MILYSTLKSVIVTYVQSNNVNTKQYINIQNHKPSGASPKD